MASPVMNMEGRGQPALLILMEMINLFYPFTINTVIFIYLIWEIFISIQFWNILFFGILVVVMENG